MLIIRLIKKILFGYKASSDSYVNFLKKQGVTVGNKIEIFFPRETFIDYLNPHLLSIGSNVSMTGPTTILTHDYSVCVLKKWSGGEILGKQQRTKIGNNVFLGWGCTILPGATIEDNVIIGANEVVSGHVESDSIYAGNPAKKIGSILDYYNKRKSAQFNEAKTIYHLYKKKFGCIPPMRIFHEYFMLFSKGNEQNLIPEFRKKMHDHGNFLESKQFFMKNKPLFNNFDEFVDCCESEEKKSTVTK